MRPLGVAALVSVLTLGACGDDGDGETGERPPERPDPVELRWMRAQVAPDGEVVRLGYVNDPCTRARQARVAGDETAVTITLLDPERDPEQACIALAKPGCAEVSLPEPLGGRRLVDGARGSPPEQRDGERAPFSRFEPCRRVTVVQ